MNDIFYHNKIIKNNKNKYNLYIVIILLIIMRTLIFPQTSDKDRGVIYKHERNPQINGRKCALIIGIGQYKGAATLKNPVFDAQAIEGLLLNKYDYKSNDVKTLYDAKANWDNINEELKKYLGEDGLKEDDSLLLFFSGHGWSDELDTYWLPFDFGLDIKPGQSTKESRNIIPMSQIQAFLGRCKAAHIFIIADSCFSGKYISLFEKKVDIINYNKKSRQILVSGREWVADDDSKKVDQNNHSPFVKSLLKFLQNNWNEFTADTLITQVLSDFRTDINQEPDGGNIDYVGDEGGQFMFVPEYSNQEFKWAQKVKDLLNRKDKSKSENSMEQLINDCEIFLVKNPRPTYRLITIEEQLKSLIIELKNAVKNTKKLKEKYTFWIKADKKLEKIKECKDFLKYYKNELLVDEDIELMRKEIENFVDMQFENDFSGWKESTENSDIKIKKKEIVTVKFLNMYKDIERIVDRIEPVEIYFNNTFKIKPLYFSLGFGGSLINSALIPDFDELKFANFEVGYHFKFGYFLDDSILLTPFILGANQLGEQVSFNLSTTNYTLAVKAEKAAMFGVGLKLIMRDTIEKVGNMELGLGLFYSRYYLNIHGINNELTNTSLAFIEIDNRKFQDIFYINMEISFEAFPWLYVGIRYTFPTTSKLLFKYEININPETKLNFKFPAGIAAVTSLGIKIYI